MPVYQTFYELAAVQFVVVVCIVHFKIMKLKFLITHFTGINRNVHVFSNVTKIYEKRWFKFKFNMNHPQNLTLFPFAGCQCGVLVVVDRDAHDYVPQQSVVDDFRKVVDAVSEP
jgi:hypothetical protein